MNKQESDLSFQLYNFILNALIALELEANEKSFVSSSSKKSLFLGAWLKKAKKQRRYPKSLAQEVENLINIYLLKGQRAKLSELLSEMIYEYRLLLNIKVNSELTAKFRFDSAMQALSIQGWKISLPITQDIDEQIPYRSSHSKEIFTSKRYWEGAFDKEHALCKEISIFVVSSPQLVIDYLYDYGFILIKGIKGCDHQGKFYYQYTIFPNNKCTGKPAIPTIIKK